MRPTVHRAVLLLSLYTGLTYAQSIGVRLETLTRGGSVGEFVAVNAVVADTDPNDVLYRYRIRTPADTDLRLVRDYSPTTWIGWVPMAGEGIYTFEVTARNRWTGATATTTSAHNITSNAAENTPVLSPTQNVLVYVYSAPPCPTGSTLRVTAVSASGVKTQTPAVPCYGTRSTNTYVAGLRPNTRYTVHHTLTSAEGLTSTGPALMVETGALPFNPSPVRVTAGTVDDVLYENRVFERSVATDGTGAVIWYYEQLTPYLIPAEPGGYFFAILEVPEAPHEAQILRLIDLAGNAVLETNAARLNEQLVARGMRPITNFHHDARRLPDGSIMAIAATEVFVRPPDRPEDTAVFGDTILVLDRDLQLQWAWDAFDHLDVRRAAILGEICAQAGGAGCPVSFLPGAAEDWVHGNSISLTPDGHILYSARHQDWVLKIDFANGRGSGRVLWRLGRDGDFRLIPDNSDGWFSHQHDASFVEVGGRFLLLIFDNGNTRAMSNEAAQSRGQLYEIDEANRTARLVLNADLGSYSFALGSAQLLPDGTFHFRSGLRPDQTAEAVEVDLSGRVVTRIESGTPVYRSYRLADVYSTIIH